MKGIQRNHWELLVNFTSRNLKLKYQGSFLGFLWSLITPLLQMFIYTLVFSFIIRVRVQWPYAVFLLTAQLPWIFFASSLQMGASSIIEHGNLVKKVQFPRALLPLSVVLSNLISFGITMSVLVLFMIFYRIPFTVYLVSLIPAISILFFFTLGLTFITGCLAVFFRDIFHILEVLLLVWFWVLPIVYPITLLDELDASPAQITNQSSSQQESHLSDKTNTALTQGLPRSVWIKRMYKLNPLVSMVELFRYSFLYQAWPPLKYILYGLVWALISLSGGLAVFRKTSPYFAREI